MDSDDRLVAYAKQTGQLRRVKIRLTPKQRRRYWKKWFCGVYIEPVFLDEATGAWVAIPDEVTAKARKDREAPNPVFRGVVAAPNWQDSALEGEDFWAWMDRNGVRWG